MTLRITAFDELKSAIVVTQTFLKKRIIFEKKLKKQPAKDFQFAGCFSKLN